MELLDVEWKDEILSLLRQIITLYLKYHASGTLEKISIHVNVPEYEVLITIVVDGEEQEVDMEAFQMATEDQERDAQRECFFAAESIWPEFLMENDTEEMALETMETVVVQLQEIFAVPVEVSIAS